MAISTAGESESKKIHPLGRQKQQLDVSFPNSFETSIKGTSQTGGSGRDAHNQNPPQEVMFDVDFTRNWIQHRGRCSLYMLKDCIFHASSSICFIAMIMNNYYRLYVSICILYGYELTSNCAYYQKYMLLNYYQKYYHYCYHHY